MAIFNVSIRIDSEFMAQAVPLSPSLSSDQSLCADLLRAKADRTQGAEYIPADDVLASMERVVKGVVADA